MRSMMIDRVARPMTVSTLPRPQVNLGLMVMELPQAPLAIYEPAAVAPLFLSKDFSQSLVPFRPKANSALVPVKVQNPALAPVKVPDSVGKLSKMTMPKYSAATVDGDHLPLVGGMTARVPVTKLRDLLELEDTDRVLKTTGDGKTQFLHDDDVVDLTDPETEIRVIRPAVAS